MTCRQYAFVNLLTPFFPSKNSPRTTETILVIGALKIKIVCVYERDLKRNAVQNFISCLTGPARPFIWNESIG
jgi:hypothetical protein